MAKKVMVAQRRKNWWSSFPSFSKNKWTKGKVGVENILKNYQIQIQNILRDLQNIKNDEKTNNNVRSSHPKCRQGLEHRDNTTRTPKTPNFEPIS